MHTDHASSSQTAPRIEALCNKLVGIRISTSQNVRVVSGLSDNKKRREQNSVSYFQYLIRCGPAQRKWLIYMLLTHGPPRVTVPFQYSVPNIYRVAAIYEKLPENIRVDLIWCSDRSKFFKVRIQNLK
jgi:hypothetical protein